MRWPFRRRIPAPVPPRSHAPTTTRPEGAWRDLAPLARAATDPSVASPGRFPRSLASRWQVPPALGQLGHAESLAAPAGHVGSAVRAPVTGYSGVSDLVWPTVEPDLPAPGAGGWPEVTRPVAPASDDGHELVQRGRSIAVPAPADQVAVEPLRLFGGSAPDGDARPPATRPAPPQPEPDRPPSRVRRLLGQLSPPSRRHGSGQPPVVAPARQQPTAPPPALVPAPVPAPMSLPAPTPDESANGPTDSTWAAPGPPDTTTTLVIGSNDDTPQRPTRDIPAAPPSRRPMPTPAAAELGPATAPETRRPPVQPEAGRMPRPVLAEGADPAPVARPLLGGLSTPLVMTRTLYGPAPDATADQPVRPTTGTDTTDEPDVAPPPAGGGETGLGVPSWFTGLSGVPDPGLPEAAAGTPMAGFLLPDLSPAGAPAPASVAGPPQGDRTARVANTSPEPTADEHHRLPPASAPWTPRRRSYRLGPPLPASPHRETAAAPPPAEASDRAGSGLLDNPGGDGWSPDAAPMHAANSLLDFARTPRPSGAGPSAGGESAAAEAPDRSAIEPAAPAAHPGGQQVTDPDTLSGQLYDQIRGRLRAELLVDRERAALLSDRY